MNNLCIEISVKLFKSNANLRGGGVIALNLASNTSITICEYVRKKLTSNDT